MAQNNREGFYTQITKGFKKPLVGRIKKKKRTIKYFIEGFCFLTDNNFDKVFELIDEAHQQQETAV